MNWDISSKSKINPDSIGVKNQIAKIEDIITILLENRGLTSKKEIEDFLNPKLESVTPKSVGIDSPQLKKAFKRILQAIEKKEQIVVYGDYDVDGIAGSAILWETLYRLGAKTLPYIPNRIEEGYGLSIAGIKNVINNVMPNLVRYPKGTGKKILNPLRTQDFASAQQVQDDKEKKVQDDKEYAGGLIITVDNGIVAHAAVEFANTKGIDVIITDHHVPSTTPPKAHSIVHTTALCGAGVAWILGQEFKRLATKDKRQIDKDDHLELVALATIADLVQLKGANRTLTKFGLQMLSDTKRIGHLELFKEAALNPKVIGVYEVGHVIAPRLNAMGRLESALDSLRLLCTKDPKRAAELALKLGQTNKERQFVTQEASLHAVTEIRSQGEQMKKLIFIANQTYQQGVIGLVAGRLVETFYRPAIVVSIGEKYSKASARSVKGFNIIEFIRGSSDLLVDAGGHPMAAGFTVETEKLSLLQETLEKRADQLIEDAHLTRTLRIDCELPLSLVSPTMYDEIQKLSPFGMGNPEPVFVSRGVMITDMRLVGKEGKHARIKIKNQKSTPIQPGSKIKSRENEFEISGIWFGGGERASEFHVGDGVDVVYSIDQNEWPVPRSFSEVGNGNKRLQLKVRDVNKN